MLEFNNGELTETKTYINSIAKKSTFFADPNSNSFLDFVYSRIDWDILPELENKHIQVFIGIQPNKDGLLDSIIGKYTYMLDGTEIITDENNVFLKEAKRIAELIPDWDVVYQRGLIVSRGFMIVFDENNKNKYTR